MAHHGKLWEFILGKKQCCPPCNIAMKSLVGAMLTNRLITNETMNLVVILQEVIDIKTTSINKKHLYYFLNIQNY
jgi:hypothetical protein